LFESCKCKISIAFRTLFVKRTDKQPNKFTLDFAHPLPYTEISILCQGELNMENRYFCGWDGGGTKTEVLCVSESDR